MNSFDQFSARVDRIMALGYSEWQASKYASLISDVYRFDEDGNVMVVDLSGRLLATLPPSVLGDGRPQAGEG